MRTSKLLPEECREEIRKRIQAVEVELKRKPSNVVEWTPYWRRKFRAWLHALKWVLNEEE